MDTVDPNLYAHRFLSDFISQEKLFYSEISKLILHESYTNKTSPPEGVLLLCKSGHAYSQLLQKTREFLSILLNVMDTNDNFLHLSCNLV